MSLVLTLGAVVQMVWILSGFVILLARRFGLDLEYAGYRPFRWLWAELRPFYLPAVAFYIGDLVMHGQLSGWNIFNAFAALLGWWFYKDADDDDRWKRRKAKLVEKVTRRGSRLVAVPVGGGS